MRDPGTDTTYASPLSPPDAEQSEAQRLTLPAEGMDCPSCASTATRALLEIPGVRSVDPDVIGQEVRVSFDTSRTSVAALTDSLARLGYGPPPPRPKVPASAPIDSTPSEGFLSWIPAHLAAGASLWLLTIAATLSAGPEALVAVLAVASVAAAGWDIFRPAWEAARRLALDMHVLMTVAAVGALLIGEFVEAGAVLVLFAVARELENRALRRARAEVRSLMDLVPVQATVLRHGHQVVVPVEAVRPGEIVLVRPGERVPVDGTVAAGFSEVDASAITGESIPEPKGRSDTVYGGSVNGTGALEIRCDLSAEDSALGRIITSIEAARAQKSPTEAFIDRFARIYTPAVMVGALLLASIPPALGLGPVAEWGYRALVLVVIACPCALVISTPVTVVSALTGAVRRGLLIKSGVHLEVIGRTQVVAFDKTGTLTEGHPRVSDILSLDGTSEEDILAWAAAAEKRSEHPIARAVVDEATRRGVLVPEGTELFALPGRGARARVGEREVLLGSPRLFMEEGLLDDRTASAISRIEAEGAAAILVGWTAGDDPVVPRGILALTDRLREGFPALATELRALGVKRLVCMSGDRSSAVEGAARGAGASLDEWRGDMLPEEKVRWIEDLRRTHGPVLMVGDGVNDAPALAVADIGVAMAAGGTALALDAADIALIEDELGRLPEAFRLGRKAARIIRANIAFALLVKLVFVAMGGVGLATLWMAVAADMGSSLIVILNGLRALRA